jgi:hypothetical protein
MHAISLILATFMAILSIISLPLTTAEPIPNALTKIIPRNAQSIQKCCAIGCTLFYPFPPFFQKKSEHGKE